MVSPSRDCGQRLAKSMSIWYLINAWLNDSLCMLNFKSIDVLIITVGRNKGVLILALIVGVFQSGKN